MGYYEWVIKKYPQKFRLLPDDTLRVYEHTKYGEEIPHILHRIEALIDIPEINVKKGDLGGYVETEDNLYMYATDRHRLCWVADKAKVFGYASVRESARVSGNAAVYGHAEIYGSAHIYGNAKVFDNAVVFHASEVYEDAVVCEFAVVCGLYRPSKIHGKAYLHDDYKEYDGVNIIATWEQVSAQLLHEWATERAEVGFRKECEKELRKNHPERFGYIPYEWPPPMYR